MTYPQSGVAVFNGVSGLLCLHRLQPCAGSCNIRCEVRRDHSYGIMHCNVLYIRDSNVSLSLHVMVMPFMLLLSLHCLTWSTFQRTPAVTLSVFMAVSRHSARKRAGICFLKVSLTFSRRPSPTVATESGNGAIPAIMGRLVFSRSLRYSSTWMSVLREERAPMLQHLRF